MKPSSLVPAALLAIAAILGLLVAISLPSVHFFDIVRVTFSDSGVLTYSERWGIWGGCFGNKHNRFSCFDDGLGYDVDTRGLVVHVVALGCTVVALGLAFSEAVFTSLPTLIASFQAALLFLISMAMDIVLYAHVRSVNNYYNPPSVANTGFGPAFWMTLAATLACLGAGFIAYINRGKEAYTNSYSGAGAWVSSV